MINNIKKNQIIWSTHNIKRDTKCEPPSGADILISIELALLKKYPYSIAIDTNGIWIYKITEKLTKKIKKDIKGYKSYVNWWISALDDLYCSPNFDETMLRYFIEDFEEVDINPKMKNLKDYYNNINKIFKGHIYIEYVKFL